MKKALCVFLAALITLSLAGISLADHREERYIQEEAARRNMRLISSEEAVRIARNRIGGSNVRIKDVDLEDEDDYYRNPSDFRPVWSIEAVSGRDEYDIDVDAVTGEVLKFKIND